MESALQEVLDEVFQGGVAVRSILANSQQGRSHARTKFSDLKHLKNVLCRERGDVPGSICPWHSLTERGCKPRGEAKCSLAHKARKKAFCPEKTCQLGATCGYRHKTDVYGLYIPQRGGTVRWITFCDTLNEWSPFKHMTARAAREASGNQKASGANN